MARTKELTVAMPDLDGGELSLRLDFNAIARAEEATGMNLMSGEGGREMSGTELRAVVHACAAAYDEARGKEPRFKLIQIGRAMGLEEAVACIRAVRELMGSNVAAPDAMAAALNTGSGEEGPTEAPAEAE